MHKYLILQDPGHNRVYYKQSQKLSMAELKLACSKFGSECHNFDLKTIADIRYFYFEAANEISEIELEILSRLSFVFAIFKLENFANKECLIPMAKKKYEYVDPKISSLLKYSGKTNEIFTKMMIDVAYLSSGFYGEKQIRLLDPIAGKGTTLFEGIVHGFDVAGIEIEQKSVHELCVFFKRYLETERYKHSIRKGNVRIKETNKLAATQHFEFARSKEEFKDENHRKKLDIVSGNSIHADQYFKKNSFHLIVGDLPYGIGHGNVGKQKGRTITRSPAELLKECLPGWHKVLKPKGALVIAWNKFVMPKKDVYQLLEENGFNPLKEDPYNEFEHKVDMSIKRDIVVATLA